jgi:hypothetical protein
MLGYAQYSGGMKMTDMETRLQESAKILPDEVYTWLNPLLNNAAYEIARLRFHNAGLIKENDLLRASNKRLRVERTNEQ